MSTATQRTPAQDAVLIAQLRDIYDAYRSAQLTRRYYEARLASVQGAAQSKPRSEAVAIGVLLLIFSIMAPMFAPVYVLIMLILIWASARTQKSNPDIARFAGIASAFHAHALSLREVVNKVHNTHDMPHELLSVYTASRRQIAEMELALDAEPDRVVLNECYEKVNREIGARGLWMPKAPERDTAQGLAMEDAIHQTRLGGQVAITPRVGLEPPAPWPSPGM